jgi:hypothetical protein
MTACSQEAKYGRRRVRPSRETVRKHGPAGLEAAVLSIKTEEENCNA